MSARPNKIAQIDKDKCQTFLDEFCDFLDKQPKPSDSEVRDRFLTLEKRWVKYCAARKLTGNATLMFNKEVAERWWKVYAIKKDNNESVIQQS